MQDGTDATSMQKKKKKTKQNKTKHKNQKLIALTHQMLLI